MRHPGPLPPPVPGEAPLALAYAAERVTRRWLLRVLERISPNEAERLPDNRLVAEAPALVAGLVEALGSDAALKQLEPGAPMRDRLLEIAALRGERGESVADVLLELADLQIAIAEELLVAGGGLGGWDVEQLSAAHARLIAVFGQVQAALVEEHLRGRSQRLEELASTDPLTGLYNVRVLRDRLSYLARVQKRYRHPFSLLVIDLDGLKEINDGFGHAAGDEALLALASVLRSVVRDVDVPARVGGDEFCLLLPETATQGARAIAMRIADAAPEIELLSGARLRVSIGVASAPADADDPDRLLELADSSMYEAKRSGATVGLSR